MREIKFRGVPTKEVEKDLGRCFAIGSFIRQPKFDTKECGYIIGDSETNEMIPVKKETIGQFTGLKDKNGVEIYEGDILDSITGRPLLVKQSDEYSGISLAYKNEMEISLYKSYANKSVIIGNIHQNPELLK